MDDKHSYVMKLSEMRCVMVSEIHKLPIHSPLTHGYSAGSFALHLDASTKRCKLRLALGDDKTVCDKTAW